MNAVARTVRVAAAAFGLFVLGAQAGPAQVAAPSTTPARTLVVTLGTTAGPNPRKDRAQFSNLVVVNGTYYVVDAGDNVTRRIVQAGYDVRKPAAVFITHGHSDHTLGLAALLVSAWEYQRRDPLDVYGPPGVQALVDGALAYAKVNEEIRFSEGKTTPMRSLFHGHDVAPGVVYRDANVTVSAFENSHFHFQPGTPPYGKYRSYGYRFQTPDGIIVFTGDTGPSDAVTAAAKGADLLLSEIFSIDDLVALYQRNGVWQTRTKEEQDGAIKHFREEHLTPDEVGKLATAAGVKRLVLTHLQPTEDAGAYERYATAVRRLYGGPVAVAKDLSVFPLP